MPRQTKSKPTNRLAGAPKHAVAQPAKLTPPCAVRLCLLPGTTYATIDRHRVLVCREHASWYRR